MIFDFNAYTRKTKLFSSGSHCHRTTTQKRVIDLTYQLLISVILDADDDGNGFNIFPPEEVEENKTHS
jgi:hypothetical protein